LLDKRSEELDLIANEVISDVSTYSQSNIQHDDITFVLLKWKFNNYSLEK
jgi:hypothetical protein